MKRPRKSTTKQRKEPKKESKEIRFPKEIARTNVADECIRIYNMLFERSWIQHFDLKTFKSPSERLGTLFYQPTIDGPNLYYFHFLPFLEPLNDLNHMYKPLYVSIQHDLPISWCRLVWGFCMKSFTDINKMVNYELMVKLIGKDSAYLVVFDEGITKLSLGF